MHLAASHRSSSRAPFYPSIPILVTAAMLAIGIFAPWIAASDSSTSGAITGLRIDGSDEISTVAVWLIAAAVALTFVACVRRNHSVHERVAGIAVIAFTFAPVYLAATEYQRLTGIVTTLRAEGFLAQVGWGWWVTIAAALPALVGLVTIVVANHRPSEPPTAA